MCTNPRVGLTAGKSFHSDPHDYDYVYKLSWCLLEVLYHCKAMTSFASIFLLDIQLFFFVCKRLLMGTTNFTSVLGGYLSPYAVWGIDFLPSTTLMKPLLGVPLGIHLVLITLSYLICSLFKQEWMLRFASGVCLSMGPFLLLCFQG